MSEVRVHLPKHMATVSGYEVSAHGRHVHCSECGAIVAELLALVKMKKARL